jgi:nucleolar protein 14
MPPSQLKQLKASLKEHGVLGPQKSKKQRKASAKDGQQRQHRRAALESVRDNFNPFETKTSARPQKYQVVSNKEVKVAVSRPGVTRGLGEERRRDTLLKEIQTRHKVGGLLDRRFGENDPTLTPEQKAAERFARQNERKLRKTSMFNLENDSEEELALTHGGRSLDFGDTARDDYKTNESDGSEAGDFEDQDDRPTKRMRVDDQAAEARETDGDDQEFFTERKKTKNEVMKEVIAKSKLYKAERQAAKADDEDLRMELDQGMSEIYAALQSNKPVKPSLPTPPSDADPTMNPARAAMLAGKSREEAEKEYEVNLRQMKLDARSKPTFRTKTDEEKALEEAERLHELERKRVRRMKGDVESSADEESQDEDIDEDVEQDDAELFGLNQPEPTFARKELDVEDEDEFLLEDDLIASGSENEMASEEEGSSEGEEIEDDGDDDFINGLVLPKQSTLPSDKKPKGSSNLAFTYDCPETHEEFLLMLKDKTTADVSTVVQRIRALHHKGLAEDNVKRLGKFTHVLVEHVVYMLDKDASVNFDVVESVIRHLHSMAKSQPHDVTSAFRTHLVKIAEERPLDLTAGDLMVLTAVSTIFPTSDHFHPVATPAMLTIARCLGQSSVNSLKDLGKGAYCCTLALQYQRLAKRYVPEVVTYVANALMIFASPSSHQNKPSLDIPVRLPEKPLNIQFKSLEGSQRISFSHLLSAAVLPSTFPTTLLNTYCHLTQSLTTLWQPKSAFPELINPLITTLKNLLKSTPNLPPSTTTLVQETLTTLQTSQTTQLKLRLPLLLHTHRPLAIKSSLPSFIDNYNPTSHYDPNKERADLNKLRAEHKKERKGAMRELRKDANFIAREQLREKKERDEAYEKKFKRLVAEIQGEEGKEGKEYERERERRRKRGRK